MNQYLVKIKTIQHATHDVLRIVTERPPDYSFNPGQAADITINKQGWRDEKRPFTFTCLPDSDFLEFHIKTYPSREGVTRQLLNLKQGDELYVHKVFGDIAYRGEGLFIAGGAGITPFIAILRYLKSKNEIGNNKLIFANKTKADIINEDEFRKILGPRFINILSEEKAEGFDYGILTESFLENHLPGKNKHLYLCGPPPMMDAVEKYLVNLKVDEKLIIKEGF